MIDVEGSDAAVLRGGSTTFPAHRARIHLTRHGEQRPHECGRLFVRRGYRINSAKRGPGHDRDGEWLAGPA